MSTQKTQRQPMSDKNKLTVIIVAICLVAVIAVSITLGVLLKAPTLTPDDETSNTTPSSSLPVKNGDFALVSSDDTSFPKSALNWSKYGYKAPSGNTHEFEAIDTNTNVVMGIVDTDDKKWSEVVDDLKKLEDITIAANPKQYALGENDQHDNSNVYMIATKTATNAMIMSDSVSVSATTSVKITVHVNTSQITSGTATIMIQNSSSTPNAKEDNRYAYKYQVAQSDGWQEFDFWVFNRKTSTQYIRVSVGIGNSYDETLSESERNAEGILYIDDITYETVTANDYRIKADEAEEGDTTYKIIEKEEDTTVAQKSEYLTFKGINGDEKAIDFATSESYVNETKKSDDANGYSPFTTKDDFTKAEDSATIGNFGIYKLENIDNTKAPVALQLSNSLELKLDEEDDSKQDYAHVSFWTRTVMNNKLAYANILVQRLGDDNEWTTLSNGDFTIKTEQNIETDTNNGWAKYDIYLKPAQNSAQIRIVVALGSAKGYQGTSYAPKGTLYVTTPYFETVSSSAYTSASSSTASKKYDLTGSTADSTITNGSFSSIVANTNYPSNWTPAFAGQNIIYKDGKGDIAVTDLTTDVNAVAGSGVVTNPYNDYADDDANKALKLVSHAVDGKLSSYGMLSGDITASKHTVYVFSVLAKMENGAKPYFYLLETGVERSKSVLAKVENIYVNNTIDDDNPFCLAQEGWVRYYVVYVTGDNDTTVKLALFNGSIDGTEPAADGATVYYDKVTMQTIGTYSMVEDEENKDATEYKVSFSASEGFVKFEECEDVDAVITEIEKLCITQNAKSLAVPTDEEWTEMKKIPEEEEDNTDNSGTSTKKKNDVNLALLFSILSSVLLIAALAVVVVLKLYKDRKKTNG